MKSARIGGARWGGSGALFPAFYGIHDLVIDHNTAFQDGSVIYTGGAPSTGFVYRNNLAPHNTYGVYGDGAAVGLGTLTTYFPGFDFERNILAGGDPTLYPTDNFFPASLDDVGFVDRIGGNYRLSTTSPYKNRGTDGRDIGVDVDALEAKTAGVLNGSTAQACGRGQMR